MSVQLASHDPQWAILFEAEKVRIGKALGEAGVELHHIGSTAIPGIVAKPVIDILCEAESLEQIDAKAGAMRDIGYTAHGEYGIPGRRYFKRSGGELIPVHLHCFKGGSVEIERHLAFRDFLRAHPEEAAAYSDLKMSLAGNPALSRQEYQAGKEEFIRAALAKASRWGGKPAGQAFGQSGSPSFSR